MRATAANSRRLSNPGDWDYIQEVSKDPRVWEIQGSNDGVTFTNIFILPSQSPFGDGDDAGEVLMLVKMMMLVKMLVKVLMLVKTLML